MIDDILQLRQLDFSSLNNSRFKNETQTCSSKEKVDLTTACFIHYSFYPGMLIRYMKGEYVGKERNAKYIIEKAGPYIDKEDAAHIRRIITHGCPSYIDFEEEYENKLLVLQQGNQHTFLKHPEVTAKAMKKEEKTATSSQ